MNRKYQADGPEFESQPGSHGRVLRNLVGITRVREMQRAESAAHVEALEALLAALTVDDRFTADDIRMLHRTWLGAIYPWAGEYRTVDVSKAGIMFANAASIPQAMRTFETDALAKYTPCQFPTRREQAEAIAIVHAELVIIHPFREGNGRCARMLAVLMAAQAGLPVLDFGSLDGRGRPTYFRAIRQAWAKQNYEPLIGVFDRVVRRTVERDGPGA